MSVDSAIAVAELIVVLGKVEGRKRLQKIVHLLKVRGARDFPYRFILHYFGPFSRELASDLDFVVGTGLVEEQAPPGGEGSYVYTPRNPAIGKRVRRLRGHERHDPDWADLAGALAVEDTGFLETLSTVVFLADRKYEGKALRDEFGRVKPHLKGQFDKAVQRGKDLQLLRRQLSV